MPTARCTPQQLAQYVLTIQGRALRSIVHEISNPLQAVTSAISLAREDLHNPADLTADLDIVQPELTRMKAVLYAARRLYHPPEDLTARGLLDDLRVLSRKVLQWHNLTWEAETDSALAPTRIACPVALVAALGTVQYLAESAPDDNSLCSLRIGLRVVQSALCFVFRPGYPVPVQGWEDVHCLLTSCNGKLVLQPDGVVLCFPVRRETWSAF